MSMRTVCEFNHDYLHKIRRDREEFVDLLMVSLAGGKLEYSEELRQKFGVNLAETAHHSDDRQYTRNGRVAKEF